MEPHILTWLLQQVGPNLLASLLWVPVAAAGHVLRVRRIRYRHQAELERHRKRAAHPLLSVPEPIPPRIPAGTQEGLSATTLLLVLVLLYAYVTPPEDPWTPS